MFWSGDKGRWTRVHDGNCDDVLRRLSRRVGADDVVVLLGE